jgi:alkylation response protein AidB-like acyl-CoA dehydrogenase
MSDLNVDETRATAFALESLLAALASNAAQRDKQGGTAKHERDLIRDSGLLTLSIPHEFGGGGADWVEIFAIIRRMAAVDSSLAHLFAFHHLMIATLQFFGTADQTRRAMEKTVREHCFWGNAVNPRDSRLRTSARGVRVAPATGREEIHVR